MSLTMIKSERVSSSKVFKQFHNENGEVVEVHQSFFRNRKTAAGKIVRLSYELWDYGRGKTCKVITSTKDEKGSRRIIKGKSACRAILDKFKALPLTIGPDPVPAPAPALG